VCAFVTCYARCWQHTVNRIHPFRRNKVIIYNNNIYARRVWCFSYTYICMCVCMCRLFTRPNTFRKLFLLLLNLISDLTHTPTAMRRLSLSLSRFLKCCELLAVDDELTRAVAYVVSSLREPLEPQRVKVPIT